MSVNQKNVSAINGFAVAAPAFYGGPVGMAPGGPGGFTAAVLCRIRTPVANGFIQTLWSNFDGPNFGGWAITADGTALGGHITITTSIGNGAATPARSVDLGAGPLGKLSLIHLVVEDDVRQLYYNGALIDDDALALPPVGSTLGPQVGLLPVIGAPAQNTDILGVAYAQSAFDADQIDNHFRSCHRAMAMARPDELTPSVDFTNRFDARDGAIVGGAQASFNALGDVTALPLSAASWLPSAGADPLTRTGVLRATVLTNPVWGYTTAEEGSDFIANTYAQNFVFADLVAGVLSITHNLNSPTVAVVVRDNTNALIVPDAVTMPTANTATIDLTTFGAFAGTWRVLVIGQ